jgi:hypothetical protein
VPQVRPSVPGTKKMGEAQRSLFAELVSSPAMTQTPTVQFLSRPRIKGCPTSRSFFARCGIPRLPIYILRLSRDCQSRSAVSHISRKTSESGAPFDSWHHEILRPVGSHADSKAPLFCALTARLSATTRKLCAGFEGWCWSWSRAFLSMAIYEFNSLSFLPTAPGPKLI